MTHPCRAVLLMLAELHQMGYQSIRLCPKLSNSGVHWIAWFTNSLNVLDRHGAMLHPEALARAWTSTPSDTPAACYTSAQERRYFDWDDAADDSPKQLATKFVTRFPTIAAGSKQPDSTYVNWYGDMIRQTEPDGLPSTCASSPETGFQERHRLVVLGNSTVESVTLPPLPLRRTGKTT
jgi:hypothetical protein